MCVLCLTSSCWPEMRGLPTKVLFFVLICEQFFVSELRNDFPYYIAHSSLKILYCVILS